MRVLSSFSGYKKLILPIAVILILASGASASTHASGGRGDRLMRFFAEEFKPERVRMILEKEPKEDGLVKEIYLEVEGCDIGGVRIDSLILRAVGVSFTPPSQWEEESPDIREILNVHATARITENDLNENLLQKQFGDDRSEEHTSELQSPARISRMPSSA